MDKLLDRLQSLILGMDVGVPRSMVISDLLGAANRSLSRVGGVKLPNLDDEQSLARAVRALERAEL